MHYATELGFLHVTKTLVRKHPQLMTMTTEDQLEPVKKRAMLPVELAMEGEKDQGYVTQKVDVETCLLC